MANKSVTIGLKFDSHFVNMLNASVALSGLRHLTRQLTPAEQLVLTALMESRGGLEDEIASHIRPDWQGHIEIVPELRSVEKDD
jgi:hypothetical protein